MSNKKILAEIWKLEFVDSVSSKKDLKTTLGITEKELKELQKKGLIDGYRLTGKGRKKIKVVACGGVFDILHPGHGFILSKSRGYGDILVVIIARDETVKKRKRIPIVPEEQRLEMVRMLRPVDVAILGKKGDFLSIIKDIKPDIIALGPDQIHDAGHIEAELGKRGLEVEVKRIKEYKKCALYSSKSIIQKIMKMKYPRA